MPMEAEPGDDYVRRIADYIRTHGAGLAAAAPIQRRRARTAPSSETSVFNPLGWFASDPSAAANVKPVILGFDPHHLFYLLMRLEALSYNVGSLDIKVDDPARPMNYVEIPVHRDKSDALSLTSLRSSLSVVSRLSLGGGWFGRPPPPSLDAELKFIFSSFTILPALSLHAPEPKIISELANEPPNENALPLDVFKNVQNLQCVDIDPRTLLGWDRLAEGLRSLTVKRSGMEDVSDIFIAAVKEDEGRREGRVSSMKSRRFSRRASRQSSFHSTQLPEAVKEEEEDDEQMADGEPTTPKATPPAPLPWRKWGQLRHLSLADNSLTFLPTSFLPCLTSLTHFDLSSNLLVSVPPGLSSLYNLVYLNLSDNMIDSVLGIYTMLGGVTTLILSHNRLESICGLERLFNLERVDLRHNFVEESSEIGRLAALPNIADVSIEGNPLVEIEDDYRIRCFDYFAKEKKNVLLDGSPPGFYEKRFLTSPPSEQMSSSRPSSVAYSPPVVAVGSPSKINGAPTSSPQAASSSPGSSHPGSPHLAPGPVRGRKKRNKRIVDLDGGNGGSDAASVISSRPSRTVSPTKKSTIAPSEPPSLPVSAPTQIPLAFSPRSPLPSSFAAHTPQPTAILKPKSRHSRHMTELAPSSHSPSPSDAPSFSPTSPTNVRSVAQRKSSTLSRAQARRARVTASVYEPSTPGMEEDGMENGFREADAFRARIEALRSDMGEGWLKVLNQSHLGSPPAGRPASPLSHS
ncbi:L domain-like protein [Epithele typhae]|uniref:L domain-like protein n=1 Tax=Epithele typhae TaxID=378194 RepID=UPI0020085026|nr:L domain-like protein [Epithele typhae]KAH9942467.1 L domain-like protein [Epithele typhae]